jgi:hypothetical protein
MSTANNRHHSERKEGAKKRIGAIYGPYSKEMDINNYGITAYYTAIINSLSTAN